MPRPRKTNAQPALAAKTPAAAIPPETTPAAAIPPETPAPAPAPSAEPPVAPVQKTGKKRVQLDPQIIPDAYVEPPPPADDGDEGADDEHAGADAVDDAEEQGGDEEDVFDFDDDLDDIEDEDEDLVANAVTAAPAPAPTKNGKTRVQLDPQIIPDAYVEPPAHLDPNSEEWVDPAELAHAKVRRDVDAPRTKVRVPDPAVGRLDRIEIAPPPLKTRVSSDARPLPERTMAPMRRKGGGNEITPPGAAKRQPEPNEPKVRIPSPGTVPARQEVPQPKLTVSAPRVDADDAGVLLAEAIRLISRAATRSATAEGRLALANLRTAARNALSNLE